MAEAMDIVSIARQTDRITTTELIEVIFEDFIEFHGDRSYKDDAAIVGGVGMLNGQPVTIIGNQKGHDLEENLKRNFGSPHPEGYRKSLRLMKQAEKLGPFDLYYVDSLETISDNSTRIWEFAKADCKAHEGAPRWHGQWKSDGLFWMCEKFEAKDRNYTKAPLALN